MILKSSRQHTQELQRISNGSPDVLLYAYLRPVVGALLLRNLSLLLRELLILTYDVRDVTENIDGVCREGMGGERLLQVTSSCSSDCAKYLSYSENEKNLFSALLVRSIESALLAFSLEDLEVIPVESEASDSVEPERARRDRIFSLESCGGGGPF